jgi:D-serine deaminase-like pyridoxal phosphate-dependent protein
MRWADESLALLPDDVPDEQVAALGLNLLRGDLLLPALVLKESALAHNIELMAEYCRTHGLSLAPHAKVTMMPKIISRQLDAGAWAVSAASVSQVRTLRAHGFQRIFLVNELVEPAAVDWIARELADDARFEFFCLVDSAAGADLLSAMLDSAGATRRLPVLIETGVEGGRAGCRTVEQAADVAAAIAASSKLALVGIEGFESVVEHLDPADILAAVDAFLHQMRMVAERLARDGAFAGLDEIIVSAGGSTYFDRAAAVLGRWDLGVPVRIVVRAGAYVTHDGGLNERMSPLAGRSEGPDRLRQAVEVWGAVLSRPEPDLAIVGLGKRDAPHCEGLPTARSVFRRSDGLSAAPEGMRLEALNDQHAYVRLANAADLALGDLLGCGISNPCCPGFQKWRAIPVVDDDYNVIDVARSYP